MLEVHFHLGGGGWATLGLGATDARLSVAVIDLTDALGDLAAAVLRLADGGDRAEATVLDDERHEFLLTFERRGRDGVAVEVIRAEAPRDLEPGAPERVLLAAACSLREVIQAMVDCLDEIVRSYGIDGYEAMWPAHPFPRDVRRRLVASSGRRRRV